MFLPPHYNDPSGEKRTKTKGALLVSFFDYERSFGNAWYLTADVTEINGDGSNQEAKKQSELEEDAPSAESGKVNLLSHGLPVVNVYVCLCIWVGLVLF